MKHTTRHLLSGISLCLSLSACTSDPFTPPGGPEHPADVSALAAPLPVMSTTLAASPPVDAPEPIRMMHHGL